MCGSGLGARTCSVRVCVALHQLDICLLHLGCWALRQVTLCHAEFFHKTDILTWHACVKDLFCTNCGAYGVVGGWLPAWLTVWTWRFSGPGANNVSPTLHGRVQSQYIWLNRAKYWHACTTLMKKHETKSAVPHYFTHTGSQKTNCKYV